MRGPYLGVAMESKMKFGSHTSFIGIVAKSLLFTVACGEPLRIGLPRNVVDESPKVGDVGLRVQG